MANVPDQSWECLELPDYSAADDLGDIIAQIKSRLQGTTYAQLLIAGPICLGVAAGIRAP